jgi:phosphoesterase RecJ-like protein
LDLLAKWSIFIFLLGEKQAIDKTIGTCIYTGILTDSKTPLIQEPTGNTHRIVADLIDLGVENTTIPSLLFLKAVHTADYSWSSITQT